MIKRKTVKEIGIYIFVLFLLLLAIVFVFQRYNIRKANLPTPTRIVQLITETSLPTQEIQPPQTTGEATPVSSIHPELADANLQQPLLVADKIYPIDTGYLLTGVLQSIDITDEIRIYGSEQSVLNFDIRDSNGKELSFKPTADFPIDVSTTNYSPWGVKIDGKDIAWPVTVTLEEAKIYLPKPGDTFILDVGDNPPEDQVWDINQKFESYGYYARLISIGRIPGGYEYTFDRGPQVINVGAGFEGNYPIDHAQGEITDDGLMINGMIYEGALPVGKLTIVIVIQDVKITGPWEVTFDGP